MAGSGEKIIERYWMGIKKKGYPTPTFFSTSTFLVVFVIIDGLVILLKNISDGKNDMVPWIHHKGIFSFLFLFLFFFVISILFLFFLLFLLSHFFSFSYLLIYLFNYSSHFFSFLFFVFTVFLCLGYDTKLHLMVRLQFWKYVLCWMLLYLFSGHLERQKFFRCWILSQVFCPWFGVPLYPKISENVMRLRQILVYVYAIYQYGQIFATCTIPSERSFPSSHVFSCIPSELVCFIIIIIVYLLDFLTSALIDGLSLEFER